MMNRRYLLTSRLYVFPFSSCMVISHIPLFIFCLVSLAKKWDGCYEYKTYDQWISIAAYINGIATGLGLFTIFNILCAKVNHSSSKNDILVSLMFFIQLLDFGWSIRGKLIAPLSTPLVDTCSNWESYHDYISATRIMINYNLSFSTISLFIWITFSYTCGSHYLDDKASFKRMWTNRCHWMYRLIACGNPNEQADVFDLLGELFAKYLVAEKPDGKFETIDFGDVVFCLGLVRKAQNAERKKYRETLRESVQDPMDFESDIPSVVTNTTPSLQLLEDAYRYSMLSSATYGWIFYLFYNPFKIYNIFGCCLSKPKHQVTHQDSFLNINKASYICYAGIKNEDLLYLNCHNTLFRSPYAITRDVQRKEIVISIRGSMSFSDFVVDGFARSVSLMEDESDADFPLHTHEGVLRTARSLKIHLEKGIRKKIVWDFLKDNPDWKLVTCGHSLGAAVAILLAILLRKEFPHVRAFAYASPALLNKEGAEWAKSFVTSFVYGDDVVPRLSLSTLACLRTEMIEQYARVANEKLCKVIFKGSKILEKFDEAMDPNTLHQIEQWKLRFEDLEKCYIELYLPGQVIHINTFEESRICGCTIFCGQQPLVYKAQNPSNLQRIWVNSRTIPDHMPHHYDRCLKYIIDDMKNTSTRVYPPSTKAYLNVETP